MTNTEGISVDEMLKSEYLTNSDVALFREVTKERERKRNKEHDTDKKK